MQVTHVISEVLAATLKKIGKKPGEWIQIIYLIQPVISKILLFQPGKGVLKQKPSEDRAWSEQKEQRHFSSKAGHVGP